MAVSSSHEISSSTRTRDLRFGQTTRRCTQSTTLRSPSPRTHEAGTPFRPDVRSVRRQCTPSMDARLLKSVLCDTNSPPQKHLNTKRSAGCAPSNVRVVRHHQCASSMGMRRLTSVLCIASMPPQWMCAGRSPCSAKPTRALEQRPCVRIALERLQWELLERLATVLRDARTPP